MVFILDTCALINLVAIDYDGQLWDTIIDHETIICKKVFSEFKSNIQPRLLSSPPVTSVPRIEIPATIKTVCTKKINELSNLIHSSPFSFSSIPPNTSIKLKANTGEYESALLAYDLSRDKGEFVVLFTDDIVAIDSLTVFFRSHNIGWVEDSCSLVIFLLRKISHKAPLPTTRVIEYLNRLKSEYLIPASNIANNLINNLHIADLPRNDQKHLSQLQKVINDHDYEKAVGLKSSFSSKKIIKELENLSNSLSNNYSNRINNILKKYYNDQSLTAI